MPAGTPQEAAAKWERKTAAGVGKYQAKMGQMPGNWAAGVSRFWGSAPGPQSSSAYQRGIQEGGPSLGRGWIRASS